MLKARSEQNADSAHFFVRGQPRKGAAGARLDVCDISDDEAGHSSAVSDTSHTETRRTEDPTSSYRNVYSRESENQSKTIDSSVRSGSISSDYEMKNKKEIGWQTGKPPDSLTEMRNVPEIQRPKSGRIVRGMMSGVISSSQEDALRKRSPRRSSTTYSTQTREESSMNGLIEKPGEDPSPPSPPSPALQLGKDFSAKLLSSAAPRSPARTTTSAIHQVRPPSGTQQAAESAADPYENFKLKFALGIEQEKQQRLSRKSASSSFKRAVTRPVTSEDGRHKEDLTLDDVEEDLLAAEVAQIPLINTANKLHLEGKPLDLQHAVELKKLLFGSPLCSFSEEWRIQSLTFSNIEPLKFGLVQKKGGPCGVLAAAQACFLKNLLFGSDSDRSRALHPSDTLRSSCLYRAIADIVWRAGEHKKAVVALSSGKPQFTPAGRYKADGILESLMLYGFHTYDDLLTFIQQNGHQFEYGPYGCILLTVSAVLSRSTDQVQKDLDVPTGCLLGAHAYCTQELVNLLLGGRAVSNVFNDVMELDSGNGNITILKGISARSEIGFLSLFEHYGVCQHAMRWGDH